MLEADMEVASNVVCLGLMDEKTTLAVWTECGRHIYAKAETITWELADWAAFGDAKFGALKSFCEAHGMNYDTLRTYAWVAAHVQMSSRIDKLSFGHHREVAALEPKDQEKWLAKALDENLSTAELRRQIREGEGKSNALASDGAVIRTIGTKYDEVKSYLLGQPQEFWNEDTRRIWRERLRPMVEFWQTL